MNTIEYERVYTDSTGESRFEDLTVDLNEIDFAPPAPPIFTSESNQIDLFSEGVLFFDRLISRND